MSLYKKLVDDVQEWASKAGNEHSALETQLQELQQDLTKVNSTLERTQAQLTDVNGRYGAAQIDIKKGKKALQDAARRYEDQKLRAESMHGVNKELERQVDNLSKSLNTAIEKRQELSIEAVNLREKLDNVSRKMQKLQDDLSVAADSLEHNRKAMEEHSDLKVIVKKLATRSLKDPMKAASDILDKHGIQF